jgi:hypothetical protein
MGLGGCHGDAERSRRLGEAASSEKAFEQPRLGGREPIDYRHLVGSRGSVRPLADEHGRDGFGLEPRAQLAVGQRPDMREQRRLVALVEPDGETRLAKRASVRVSLDLLEAGRGI